MPGVIMENGVRSNHDRDMLSNGIRSGAYAADSPLQSRIPQPNGIKLENGAAQGSKELVKQQPPPIPHIEEGFEMLSKLLTRMSQRTFNDMCAKIEELASMPIGAVPPGGMEDNSVENIAKKTGLLNWAKTYHAEWTKILIITNWTRHSDDVGSLIDLRTYMQGEKEKYDWGFHELSEVKRSLQHAKVPSPDFQTAVEVLSTGKASWMPDVSSCLFGVAPN